MRVARAMCALNVHEPHNPHRPPRTHSMHTMGAQLGCHDNAHRAALPRCSVVSTDAPMSIVRTLLAPQDRLHVHCELQLKHPRNQRAIRFVCEEFSNSSKKGFESLSDSFFEQNA